MSGLVDHHIPFAAASEEVYFACLRVALTGRACPPFPTPSHQGETSWFRWVVASVEGPHTSFAHHQTEGTGGGGPWDAQILDVEDGAAAAVDDGAAAAVDDEPRYGAARGGE